MKILIITVFAAAALYSQINTGAITGTVHDPGGLAVAGAEVTLANPSRGLERRSATNASGDFVFPGMEAGVYNLSITASGFKRIERQGINLPAGERLALGTLSLEIGAVSEKIMVTAEGAIVQTQSAERAGTITSSQVENLQILGRNVPSLVGLLPGVVMLGEPQGLDRGTTFSAQGGRNNQNQVSVDGLPSTDLGNGFELKLQQSMDSVAEVRILLSNYQAEYGNSAGANVEMILKSGTQQFHGLGSYFRRHEMFNANDFFNNRLGIRKPRYRFHTWTYNIGGPVFIPGKFNTNKDKLFFFWSQEFWPRKTSGAFTRTMPTELERNGDFSQSVDLNNRLITIRDPQAGAPFPGNRVPSNRFNQSSQALMKFFPMPNFFDRSISGGNYNFAATTETVSPKMAYTLKADYNINPNNFLYVTFAGYEETNSGYTNMPGWSTTWDQYFRTFKAGNKGVSGRYTRIISPTISNEFHFGWFTNPESMLSPDEDIKRNQRDTVGFLAGQLYPENNKMNLIPSATYGGVPNAADLFFNGRFPIIDPYHSMIWSDKFTMVRGAHTIKAGALFEMWWVGRGVNSSQFGSFSFARDVNNPNDTGYAYANGILGNFSTYTESSAIPYFNARSNRQEFFVQDNWRLTKRLTLDFGLRMSLLTPIYDRDGGFSTFQPGRYDPAKAVQLIQPETRQGVRVGVHPVTGAVYPAALIGALAPNVGDPANGMVVAANDASVPKGALDHRGIQWGPRIGFALDPTGKGRTSIRGGFGMFYDQVPLNQFQPLVNQIPLVQNPTLYYGNVATLRSTGGFLFPSGVTSYNPAGFVPTTMNYSLSIQHNIGFATVVDVGYVGSGGRHLLRQRNLNAIPYGTNFLPSSVDPTTRRPYSAPFLRTTKGYNDIQMREFDGTSNYHALQVSVNRRFQRGLQFGASWTWSKAMDFGSGDSNGVSPFIDIRVWNYGLADHDRTHVFKLNWMYEVPNLRVDNRVGKLALHGWQLSGITTFQSGAPMAAGLGTVVATDITGSPTEGARVVLTGNPVLPKSERTFDKFFRTEVFRMPAIGTFGNAARNYMRGPGINNFDISVFKNFPIRESIRAQFRAEAYNAFNHTQFSGVNTATRFDAAGNQTNAVFGQMNAARSARIMQLALRFMF